MSAPNYDDPTDPRTLVDSPFGRIEKWRADAMAIGGMSAYEEYMKAVRNDVATELSKHDARERVLDAREAAIAAREAALQSKLEDLGSFMDRVGAMADELERKREFDAEPIVHPPGTTPDDAPTHEPSGDLHAVEAKSEDDDSGDLPDPATAPVPPHPGHNPDPPLPEPPQVAQPIAISLNED
jgi:hypothetical protein